MLSISTAVGVLTDCVVGMCLVEEKNDDSDGDGVYSRFWVWDLLIIKW